MPPLAASKSEIQTLRRLLRRRSARSEAGRFVIEGPRLVVEALDAGIEVEAVYLPDDAAGDDVDALIVRCRAAGLEPRTTTAAVLDQVASTQTPQPALAIAPLRPTELTAVLAGMPSEPAPLVLVLCDVSDPGNGGTLLRVAEAAGVAVVVVCGTEAVDVHNPKVVRAAAGSLFRVPVAVHADAHAVLDALAARGLRLLATALGGGDDYDRLDLRGPTAVVLGSEAHGLPADVLARVDGAVCIPMLGAVESLNVGVAGAVVAFEAARQRREAP